MKKLLSFVIMLLAAQVQADPNVSVRSHQENWVAVSTFTGAVSIATAVPVLTTLYTHRSFAASNTCGLDLALVIVSPGKTLSGASISSVYIFAGLYRIVDTGSDQVFIDSGSLIYVYAPGGVAPTGCKLVLDQLF